MAHTTNADLELILKVTSNRLSADYVLVYADEGLRIETSDGSREISPRLPAQRLYEWLEAFNEGIDAMEQKAEREAVEQTERERVNAMCNGYTNWGTWHVQLVVDNDQDLYNERDEWVERCLDLEMSAQEMADEMETTSFYDRAIIESDLGEGFDATKVNWLELAQDTISDWNERQAYSDS